MRRAYVYIVSNKSHRLYVGWTTDLLARVHEHKTKAYPSSFTARYHFDRLVWFEFVNSEEAAWTRERNIKHWTRSKKVALIQEKNPNWLDLFRDCTGPRRWFNACRDSRRSSVAARRRIEC